MLIFTIILSKQRRVVLLGKEKRNKQIKSKTKQKRGISLKKVKAKITQIHLRDERKKLVKKSS